MPLLILANMYKVGTCHVISVAMYKDIVYKENGKKQRPHITLKCCKIIESLKSWWWCGSSMLGLL